MQVFAFVAARAEAFSEEETEVGTRNFVAATVARVFGDVTAAEGGGLGEVFVFAVAAGPLVIPDIKDSTGLRRGL